MKRILILLVFLHVVAYSYAQTDTSAYRIQRLKINELLAQRSAKFGQYDKSLSSRTGIFGMQTKKDIKNSNEILRQIVLNDNHIFKELKVLLDYKDLEVKQAQTNITSTSNQIGNYKQSIKKLQDLNQEANSELQASKSANTLLLTLFCLTIFSILFIGILIVRKYTFTKR